MAVLVYLTSASLERYKQSADVTIKTKLKRNTYRPREVFCKESTFKNIPKRKSAVSESLFKNVAGFQIAVLLKRVSSTDCF